MLLKILNDILGDIPYKESRFRKPPSDTYCVYFDDMEKRGGDYINWVIEHNVELEVYEYYKDILAEKQIEANLDLLGINFKKQSRIWIESEQLYETIYTFNFLEKGGLSNG